jgi:hypothetical protein
VVDVSIDGPGEEGVGGSTTAGVEGATGRPLRQYTYRRGEALCFSSRFRHSTQPGRAKNAARPPVYLCFVFGTDRAHHWPAIVQALEYLQSRCICRPDGGVVYQPT